MLRRDVRMHDDARMIHCITGAFQSPDVTPLRLGSFVCCDLQDDAESVSAVLKNILPASLTSLKLWDFLLRFLSTNSIFTAESRAVHQQTGSLITDKLIKSQMMMMMMSEPNRTEPISGGPEH